MNPDPTTRPGEIVSNRRTKTGAAKTALLVAAAAAVTLLAVLTAILINTQIH